MAKVTLPSLPNGYELRNTANANFGAIEAILNDNVLWRANPTGEPNTMQQDLDMGGNDLLNVGHLDVESLLVAGQNYEDTLNSIADRSRDEADRSLSYAQASQSSAVAAAGSAQSARDSNAFLQEFIDAYAQEILYFPLDLGFLTDVPVTSSYDLGSLL